MKYSVREKLGEGGLGEVYKVWDPCLKRYYAMKVVCGDGMAEAVYLSKLNHSMLPDIISAEFENGKTYIIMEYIEGITLTKFLTQKGQLREDIAVEWGIRILEVLCYLHESHPSFLYGDLKPDNIMVRPDGKLKLIDFGTIMETDDYRVEQNRQRYGTYGFAPPEYYDLSNNKTDIRSDIYSFGAVFYYMITGVDLSKPPFEISRMNEFNPCLSDTLRNIIQKCTQTDPDKRYQTCRECIKDMTDYKRADWYLKSCKTISWLFYNLTLIIATVFSLAGIQLAIEGKQSQAFYALLCSGVFCFFSFIIRKGREQTSRKWFLVKTTKSIFLTDKKTIGIPSF